MAFGRVQYSYSYDTHFVLLVWYVIVSSSDTTLTTHKQQWTTTNYPSIRARSALKLYELFTYFQYFWLFVVWWLFILDWFDSSFNRGDDWRLPCFPIIIACCLFWFGCYQNSMLGWETQASQIATFWPTMTVLSRSCRQQSSPEHLVTCSHAACHTSCITSKLQAITPTLDHCLL